MILAWVWAFKHTLHFQKVGLLWITLLIKQMKPGIDIMLLQCWHTVFVVSTYTRRQINLYRMFFADFLVNSQTIFMKFCMVYLRVTRRLPWNFHRKIMFI